MELVSPPPSISPTSFPHSPAVQACGEAAAIEFDVIYGEHAPLLRAIARRKFNIPDADVDALVHDVFATFLISAPRVRELRPYLIGAICNASRKYWRNQEQHESLFAELDEDSVSGEDVQQAVHRALTLNAALSRIGDRCRNVLERYYLDREPTSSIAEAIGTSPGNVLYILHICRKRARAIFGQLDGSHR